MTQGWQLEGCTQPVGKVPACAWLQEQGHLVHWFHMKELCQLLAGWESITVGCGGAGRGGPPEPGSRLGLDSPKVPHGSFQDWLMVRTSPLLPCPAGTLAGLLLGLTGINVHPHAQPCWVTWEADAQAPDFLCQL